jgi:hypothetical protein
LAAFAAASSSAFFLAAYSSFFFCAFYLSTSESFLIYSYCLINCASAAAILAFFAT